MKIENPQTLAPIKFSRVGVNLSRGTVIGHYIQDFFVCYPFASNVTWNQGPIRSRDSKFAALFYDGMKAAHFNVVGNPGDLFAEAVRERIEPEYLVGGQIEDIQMNVCDVRSRGRRAGIQSGEAAVRVSWQIFSVFDRKVVYRTETRGSADIKHAIRDGEAALITKAFADAVANLAADAKLVDLLNKKPHDIADIHAVHDDVLEIADRPLFAGPITDNIDLVRRAVVTLDDGAGHGSGFFISPTLILTNHHVAGNKTVLRVQLVTGRKVLGEVVRQHPERDVALVQVEAAGYQPLPLRREPLEVTEEVYAIGSPLDKKLAGTVTRGIVSKFGSNPYGLEDIQADVDIQAGNSGGPLLDAHGNVVGISYAGINPDEKGTSIGINLFIPIADALDKLRVTRDPTRGHVVAD